MKMTARLVHIIELWLTRRAFRQVRDEAAALDFIERYVYHIHGDARKARAFAEHVGQLRQIVLLQDERRRLLAELKAAAAE